MFTPALSRLVCVRFDFTFHAIFLKAIKLDFPREINTAPLPKGERKSGWRKWIQHHASPHVHFSPCSSVYKSYFIPAAYCHRCIAERFWVGMKKSENHRQQIKKSVPLQSRKRTTLIEVGRVARGWLRVTIYLFIFMTSVKSYWTYFKLKIK